MHTIYHIIYLFFIAILNSVDNAAIGIAYSMSGKKIPFSKNILISFMAFMVSFISSILGSLISHFLSESICAIFSVFLLALMGSRMIYQSFKKSDKDLEEFSIISNKEALAVGTVLALDDVGSSVSSGLIGYGPFVVSMPYFIISFIIFFLANYGGQFIRKLNIGKKATMIAGFLLILIAIFSIFT